MGRCLIFSGRTPARDRLVGHLATAFDDVPCVGTVGELVDGLDETPDVVLVGADDDSVWMEAVRQVRRHAPTMPVLVVAESPTPDPAVALVAAEDERAANALRLGARGFLRAGTLPDPRRLPGSRPRSSELSEREMDVLLGMTEGLSNAEIAAELSLAEDTVKTHARRLFRKLGAGDRADAVARGFRQGLLR
jgi:two-component system, NarL family, nitrate/nitrite response regulator NarL